VRFRLFLPLWTGSRTRIRRFFAEGRPDRSPARADGATGADGAARTGIPAAAAARTPARDVIAAPPCPSGSATAPAYETAGPGRESPNRPFAERVPFTRLQ